MSKQKTKEQVEMHRDEALNVVRNYITSRIDNGDEKVRGKADKFCYWLEDYIKYLNREKIFDPKKQKRYKRGDIIKANLGFNVGSEEGGLHYCVVLDKNNPLSSPVLTVIPLTSVKKDTDINNLKSGCIYLGKELYQSIHNKIQNHLVPKTEEAGDLRSASNDLRKLLKEISRMKQGSIALTGQITTISKLRIYDPKHSKDALSGIRLSNETLDMIDKEIIANYTGEKEK